MKVEQTDPSSFSHARTGADGNASDAPANRVERHGFILTVKKAGKSAMRFWKTVLNYNFSSLFRGPAKNSCKAEEIEMNAIGSPVELFPEFIKLRVQVMQEIREKNLKVFAQELELSGDTLKRTMRRLNRIHDPLYDTEFAFRYEERLCENDAEDRAAALWAAHSYCMLLCNVPLPEFEWQYLSAMESLSDKIADELEKRSRLPRPKAMPTPIGSACRSMVRSLLEDVPENASLFKS